MSRPVVEPRDCPDCGGRCLPSRCPNCGACDFRPGIVGCWNCGPMQRTDAPTDTVTGLLGATSSTGESGS